jgi:MoaA/NifB/PqqE/SkfB family radical SAM enzyme
MTLARDPAPRVAFTGLDTLWIQLTGTWCNLACVHCLNASGPRDPWLKPLDGDTVRRAIDEGEALGVRDIYFTGGEPFLHPEVLPLLERALAAAAATVLTNGTTITPATADALAALAAASAYSLEIRVSIDDVDADANDRVRGTGSLARAARAVTLLHARGLLPILTATDVIAAPGVDRYARFRGFLRGLGVDKPRVKLLPLFPIGRAANDAPERLSDEVLDGFDRGTLQCASARAVADGGVYACPILAGLPGARLSTGALAESFGPARLFHPACVTCWRTGATCRNG